MKKGKGKGKGKLNKIGIVIGILSALFFLVCTIYGGLFTSENLQTLHFNILQLMYPGFAFTMTGYIIGLLESFIYGWILGKGFTYLHKKICCAQ